MQIQRSRILLKYQESVALKNNKKTYVSNYAFKFIKLKTTKEFCEQVSEKNHKSKQIRQKCKMKLLF